MRTLLEWLQCQQPDVPRKRLKEWFAEGRVRLDGAVVTQAGLRLEDPGPRLRTGSPDAGVAAWSHRRRIHPKLVVLHLDGALAVVEKQPGLLSVPLEGNAQVSALQILNQYLQDPKAEGLRRRLFGKRSVSVLPVHRLDQYTSGLMLFAMDSEARDQLIEQVRSRTLYREYHAFTDGIPESASGQWRHSLRLDEKAYRQFVCDPEDAGATEAITHYEILKIFPRFGISKLKLSLETGLKHQIRIQAAAVGLPLVGDRVYHEQTRRLLQKGGKPPYGMARQALHAAAIGLKHPRDGRRIRFESQLPSDLQQLELRLGESEHKKAGRRKGQ